MLERLAWWIAALAVTIATVSVIWSRHEVATLRAQIASAQRQAERRAREQIARAAQAADAAVLAAQQKAAVAQQQTTRLRQELAHVTTDRPCLSAATRRVLERHPAFFPSMPASAASAARPAAAAAADSHQPVSTERDVAAWALDASALYAECRARIDALRQWDAQTFGASDARAHGDR
ncbi:MAG: hypothetical protein ACP5GC_07960 [Thiomonas sp.]